MFKLQRIPLRIRILLKDLQMIFNDHQWLHFQIILLSIILTPYKATVMGMIKILAFGTHRSKHNEFLINSSSLVSKALKLYSMLILAKIKKANEPIYFIIDDTSNKKRGKHIDAAFKFLEHTTKQYIWGQQLVCSIIEYRNIVIPYSIEVYVTKEQSKKLSQEFKKKTDIALEMLKDFEADSNQEVIVLADCYYASNPIIKYCRKKEYSFISILKSNRVFKINNQQTNVKKYSKRISRDKKKRTIVRIKGKKYYTITRKVSLKTGGVVKVVFSKQQSHRTALAVFTTNTALPYNKILEAYNKRWSIEVFFKMSKQYLGLKAYQNRNLNAIRSYIGLSLCAHNLLTHVFINDIREKGQKLTQKTIAHFNLRVMIDRVRYIANTDTIDFINNNSKNIDTNELKKFLLAA